MIRIHPWYEPQYAIPILGMILGNTLTGVSLGIERMTEELTAGRGAVEMSLALGATRWEAAQGPARQAVRAGMIPTLNQMAVVGLVSLPGMMTGQVLAGQSPLQAVRYQIVIMFLIAAASALGDGRGGRADVSAAVFDGASVHGVETGRTGEMRGCAGRQGSPRPAPASHATRELADPGDAELSCIARVITRRYKPAPAPRYRA